MSRTGYVALVCAVVYYAASHAVRRSGFDGQVLDVAIEPVVVMGLSVAAVFFATYGSYTIVWAYLGRTPNKRRRHDVRNVLRLAFGLVGLIAVFGVVTSEWVGVIFSLGIVGFAITFALQQPLFSLIGWLYIVVKRPYQVGDRIAIEEMRGDVASIDFFVTEVWEIRGDLVSSYRRRLAETPVELDVNDDPTVNVVQGESWVELRLRYLVHPRRGTRVRNALYEAILERFNDHPDRVKFPVSRNR